MAIGVIGRKAGMTRIFTEDGRSIPVTVIEVDNNRVSQVKTVSTDGYDAVQIAAGQRRATRVNKALAGHFSKAGVDSARALCEFRLTSDAVAEYSVGAEVNATVFAEGQLVDVIGQSKGK